MGPDTEPLTTDPSPPVAPAVPQGPGRLQVAGGALLRALGVIANWTGAQMMRPKIRAVVVGLALILIGAEVIDHSVWTFPIVIVGILMIVVAWVGTRLEGRFGIEWSEEGAGFEMRARFKARAPLSLPAPPLSAQVPATPTTTASGSTTATKPATPSDRAGDEHVIEGEAHTIEIDVAELKALIAAAEMATVATATTNGTPVSWQAVSSGIDRGIDGAGG